MGETEIHAQVLEDLRFALVRRYAGVPDVYVWGNLFLYYREGDPKACVAPDIFLVRGVGKRTDNRRRIYKLWEEGGVPSLVIELTSESTRDEDVEKKRLYERLRDKETGEVLLNAAEADEARLSAEARARQEAEARQAAEERASLAEEKLRALEEEMKRLRERPQ